MSAEDPTARRTARAFGLDIDLSFPAPGLPDAVGPPGPRRTRAELSAPELIDRDWPAEGTERILEEHFDRPEPDRTIDVHPDAGYRLYARHFGLARISRDGGLIACSPPDVEPWSWQRFLVGRILPWAAVLSGLEALHASAVAVRGEAVAFIGATAAGKTSLAMRLVARGAAFLTDDVLALERDGGELLAHPGAAIASIRPDEWATTPEASWLELGSVLGVSGKTYLAVPRHEDAAPLRAVYFLRRGAEPTIEPILPVDPRLLLASTFVLGVQTPARLRTQLDVCAEIAAHVPLFWLGIAPGVPAGQLAEMVEDHLAEAASSV